MFACMQDDSVAAGCITHIYAFIQTSTQDGTGGGSDNTHDIQFHTTSGATYISSLFDLPGDQATAGKGDLWELDLNNHFRVPRGTCITKSDITSVALEENGTDGWLIDSVVTVVRKGQGDTEALTIDLDADQWIDGDGDPNEQPGVVRIFPLNLVIG